MGRAHADSRTLDQSAESLGQRGVAVFILGGAGTKAIRYQNNMLFTHATGYVKRMLYDHIFWGIFFFFSEQWVFTDLNTLDFTTCKVPNKATENQIHKQLWRFQIPFHPCSVQRLDGIHSERRKAQLPPLSQNDCVEEIGGSETKPQSRWGMQRAIVEPRKGCLMDERQDGTRGCYGMGGERGVWLTLRVSAGMGEGHWRSVTFREGQQRM